MIAATLRRRTRTATPGRSPARAGDDRVTRCGWWRRPSPEHPGRGDRIFPQLPTLSMHACRAGNRTRRARLVVAALQLFSEHWYDGTTVAVIADRAGLTKHLPLAFSWTRGMCSPRVRRRCRGILAASGEASPLEAVAEGLLVPLARPPGGSRSGGGRCSDECIAAGACRSQAGRDDGRDGRSTGSTRGSRARRAAGRRTRPVADDRRAPLVRRDATPQKPQANLQTAFGALTHPPRVA